MGSKTRLGSYCTKPANNGVNLVTSRKINTRLARPMDMSAPSLYTVMGWGVMSCVCGMVFLCAATIRHHRDMTSDV